ncbi:MAG: hypothetical protein V5A55_13415 [Halovenus sp.]
MAKRATTVLHLLSDGPEAELVRPGDDTPVVRHHAGGQFASESLQSEILR